MRNLKKTAVVSTVAAATALALPVASAQSSDAETIKWLKERVTALESEVANMKAGVPGSKEMDDLSGLKGDITNPTGRRGLTIGFYGEAKYRIPEGGGSGNSGKPTFDPHRFVLLPGYQINDWLIFGSELEVEHGGIDETAGAGGAGRSRFDGEIELEQFWVDILINEHFNIRSPGIDLVPVSRFNKHHEPTVFYSTERPELYREIIPVTWYEPGMSVHGKIVEGWDYQLMVSTGLEDFNGTAGSAGVTAADGFRGARPRLRRANDHNLAYSGRLRYSGLPGLDASASFYVTELLGVADDSTLAALGQFDVLYRVPKTGLEFRGDVAYWHIADPEVLIVNTPLGDNDVGCAMYGWSVEAAYHFWPEAWRDGKGKDMDLVPFVRYTDIMTQTDLLTGSIEQENGTANKEFLTFGLAWYLSPHFVLKADYRRNLNGSQVKKSSFTNQDYFQFGVGMLF